MLERLNIYRERIKRLEELTDIRISVEISDNDADLKESTKIIEIWQFSGDKHFRKFVFDVKGLKNVNRKLYDKIRYQEKLHNSK